jgi:TM2 domain
MSNLGPTSDIPQQPSSPGPPMPPHVPQQPPMPPSIGPPQPGYFGADQSAPFGRHPLTGEPYSDKSKLTAGLLELFLGGFGAGRWYLGNTGMALGQLFTCGGCGIWALIDAIQMLTGNVRDKYGRPLHD